MKRNLFLIGMLATVLAMVIIGCDQPVGTTTVAVTGVTLDKEEITLFEEGTYTLTATVEPSNASNKNVSWESDNEDVATVSNTGEVTAVAAGTATIKVTTADGGSTKECTVTVKPLPVSIEVTKSPTAIKIGESLDLTEIEVTATYSDDSEDEAEITLENITGFNPNNAGKQTVTVTYAELTDTFDVWVLALSKIEVSLIGNLSHILIGQGEEIDLEDITVTATWKNESDEVHVITEAVTITMENLSAFDRTKVDTETVTVTVTYNGKTDTFEVLVLGVTSIAVTKQPDKTNYKIGEQLDLAGLELTVTFSDGETETIHGSALTNDVAGFDSSTLGEKIITVTYGGQTDTFTVKVVLVVTFNPNGGNWEGDTGNKTVELDSITTVAKPDDPTKTADDIFNYTFDGWYKEAGLTNAWNFAIDTITTNTTLYAKWSSSLKYAIGDTGPGGGKIFYRSETGFTMTDDNSTAHYLEAAPADMQTKLRWVAESYGDNYLTFPNITGTDVLIGTGRKNTALILATDANAPAAKACNEYTNNGKSDWFLPSRYELNELYVNRASVGNLGTDSYWSSLQYNDINSYAGIQDFGNGYQDGRYKSYIYSVRAVRAF